jgi:NAD(P)-dependent dehydrogenase (short-subunit alcohol dehydrogenase family)
MFNYINKFKLVGKTAFVVGGMGLIGVEVVKALADAEARVVVLDINENKIFNRENVKYEFFDATKLKDISLFVALMKEKYGSIDIWVNMFYPRTKDWAAKVEDLNLDSWRKNIDMHLNSYSWISREVALVMKKQRKGNIINFASIYGVTAPDFTIYDEGFTSPMAYSAIKGGIVNLTRYLSSYFGGYNIRINTICPGGIYDDQDKNFVKNYEKKVLLKRMGTPEDVAPTVLFLSSDASSYITGATIMVDGGWTTI